MNMNIKSMIVSLTSVVWVLVVLTLLTEIFPSVHEYLTKLTGHHWTSKSVIAIILFVLLSFIFKGSSQESSSVLKSAKILVLSVVIGGLIIFSYFAFNYISG